MSGRKAQAARNDQLIMEAARAVFIADPSAPVAEVARAARVGISALYNRFGSKEAMLARLCADGLRRYVQLAEASLVTDDAGAFSEFMRAIVDADVHSLTQRLAGRFTPPEDVGPLVERAEQRNREILRRAKKAGAVRPDLQVNDLTMIFEQLAAIRASDPERTRALRRRYLAVHLDGLRPSAASGKLPGTPPTARELGDRWIPPAT